MDRIKHEYLRSENYYENRSVGTRGRSKICDHCGEGIDAGEPHDVHHFYPEFSSYPTHKECTPAFLDSLLLDGEKSAYDEEEEEE